MRIVIQCASAKDPGAGTLRTPSGTPVSFVAKPAEASREDPCGTYARPDDPVDGQGRTWRELLVAYNDAGANPDHLVPAGRLYRPPVYSKLVDHFGLQNVYILSAGWGLVRGDFLLPRYDITFSSSADRHKRRTRHDQWADFPHLDDTGEPIVFFGGKDYLPLFCLLTSGFMSPRKVFFRSATPPGRAGLHSGQVSDDGLYELALRMRGPVSCGKGLGIPMLVRDLRAARWRLVPNAPGVYWWYFPESALDKLQIARRCQLDSLRLRRSEDGFVALYHGIAKSLSQRIEWHAAQALRISALKSGFLSTFRFTLLSLNDLDYLAGSETIDRFMDGLDVVWEALPSIQAAEEREKKELSGPFHYPLNIQGNAHPELAGFTRHLKQTRKAYKQLILAGQAA